MKFHSQIPIFNVRNVTASIEHYVQVLGFEKAWDWGEPPTFGCVCRDEVSIFLCEGGQGQLGNWISVFVDDVDEFRHVAVAGTGICETFVFDQ